MFRFSSSAGLALFFFALVMVVPTRAQTLQPTGMEPGPWTLVFSDEFDGTTIDNAKWNLCSDFVFAIPDQAVNPTGCRFESPPGGAERSWELPRNIEVSNGTLKLHAVREAYTPSVPGYTTAELGGTYQWTGAVLTTGPLIAAGRPATFLCEVDNQDGSQANHFCLVEVRSHVQKERGARQAVWLRPDRRHAIAPGELQLGGSGEEHDLVETVGGKTGPLFTSHWHTASGSSRTGCRGNADLAGAFDTYSVSVGSSLTRWAENGHARCTTNTGWGNEEEPMFLMLTQKINGSGPGGGVNRVTQEIDFIHVFKWTGTGTPPAFAP